MLKDMNWANRVTLIRIAFIPLVTAALVVNLGEWSPWFAAALFIVIAATDAVDGYLARSRNEVTTFGKFLDPLADKLLVTAALVALVELGSLPAWIVIIILSREFIVSGLRMVAVAEGVVIAASSYGKLKTVFQMIAIVAFILLDAPLIQGLDEYVLAGAVTVYDALFWLSWTLMAVALILTVASGVDYFYNARDMLRGPWSNGEGAGQNPSGATAEPESSQASQG
jgi:CDP-diacylglycerol--glycerol-3-phosphate 3-phosphatidyltransferase